MKEVLCMYRKLIYLIGFVLLLGLVSSISAANLIQNASVENGVWTGEGSLPTSWWGGNVGSWNSWKNVSTGAHTGTKVLCGGGAGTGTYGYYGQDYLNAGPGDVYKMSAWVITEAWGNGSLHYFLRVQFKDVNNTVIRNDDSTHWTGFVPEWKQVSFRTNPAPAGTTRLNFMVFGETYGSTWFDDMYAELMVKASEPYPADGAENVKPDVILRWWPGFKTAVHDVYFGTDYNDVKDANTSDPEFKGHQPLDANSYDPGVLESGGTYYWRIDEVNDPCVWKGDVWKFSVQKLKATNPSPSDGIAFVDPNVDLSWTAGVSAAKVNGHKVYFDSVKQNVINRSGCAVNGVSRTEPNYIFGSPLTFDDTYYWAIDEVNGIHTWSGDVWSFTTTRPGGGVKGSYYNGANFEELVLVRTDPQINFNWGDGSPAPDIVNVDQFSVSWTGEVEIPFSGTWNFYTNTDDGVRLWVDDQLLIDRWQNQPAIGLKGTIYLVAGRYALEMEYYDNAGSALAQMFWEGPKTPKQLVPQGALSPLSVRANGPLPANNDTEVDKNPTLTWNPGCYAADTAGHKLYFSNDFNDVNERKPAAGPHILSNPSYTPSGPLNDPNLVSPKTYYWRVDEVNGVTIWEGNVWRFTVPIYKVVDNFELYTTTGTRDLENLADPILPATIGPLRRTWIDGLWNMEWSYPNPITTATSGSYVQLDTDPCDGTTNKSNIAQGGTKSMKFYYDNDGTINWVKDLRLPIDTGGGQSYDYWNYTAPKYSEASAAVDDAARLNLNDQNSLGMLRNWSGYKLLKLSYYGDPNNTVVSTDKLYVTLQDGSNRVATVTNPDQTIIQRLGWHDWYISLSIGSGSFKAQNASLDLTNVARIYIGIGNKASPATGGKGAIFFDDIRLYPVSVCIPGTVAGDFSGDCKVDANDLQRMTEVWLGQMPTPPTPVINLDASGLTLGTLSTWTNTGSAGGSFKDFNTPQTGYRPTVQMVEGVRAVVFDGNDIMKANIKAPASITGSNPFTVIYKVWNLDIGVGERVFTWAKRGGTVYGRFADVGYGTAPTYGAVGHGSVGANDPNYDMGFVRGVPAAHTWHTIAVTYPGGPNGVQTVMVDGVVNATKVMTLNIWPDCNMTIGGGYDGNSTAPPSDPNRVITPDDSLFFSGALANLKVYGFAIPPKDLAVLMGTPADMKQDNAINFKDLALFAKNWMVGPVLWP